MDNISLGCQGETMAASYLSAHGYTVLQRNYSCPMGELDIVARQGDVVAFVEVKTRRSLRYGRPCEAVNFRKKQHIIQSAKWYINQHRLSGLHYRFDIVEVLARPGGSANINHIRNAFEVK